MSFDDIVDSGWQPSRWNLGWRRFNLVRAMHLEKNHPRLQKQYNRYIKTLVSVTGAQLNADADFLSMDAETRLMRMTRLIERTLFAENQTRKEVIDAMQRLRGSQSKLSSVIKYLTEIYSSATKSYLNSGVKIQKYPDLSSALVEDALNTAQRTAIEEIVKELVEPKLRAEIRILRKVDTNQLHLGLSYRH